MDRVSFFTGLGFSKYEAETLSSLITLEIATPKEISIDSEVPQNKLYNILKKFESKGLLAILPSDPKKYKLINLKNFIFEKIKEKEEQLKILKNNSSKIEQIKPKEQQHIFSLIKGQKAIMNKLAENTKNVKKEILGAQRNWKYWSEGTREMDKAIKRGVKVKLIGEINKENMKKVQEWKKIGCKIKKFNKKFGESPLRFSIFDNKEARITMGKPEIQNSKDYITIWTTSKPLISMLRNQFLMMWKESDIV